jgi:hypothetical protein
MRRTVFSLFALFVFAVASYSQTSPKPKAESGPGAAASKVATPAASDLAKTTVTAHGGQRLIGVRTLVIRGAVDFTTTAFTQAIPATFAMVFSGEKYRFDLNNPFQPIRQIFDGKNTSTTVQNGFELPPINRQGFFMLSKIGDSTFPITELPAASKKKNGFRITSPEGFYTDYFVDEKTGLIKGYESSYDVNGRFVTTSAEISQYRNVEGVMVPEKFAQRFDLGQFTVYAEFKAKEILVNTAVADEVFTVGN